jgi:RNA polymerase sigma-70 factor, ECF subfamily
VSVGDTPQRMRLKKSRSSGFLMDVDCSPSDEAAFPARSRAGLGASVEEIEVVYRERLEAFVRVCVAILGDRELAVEAVQEGFALTIRNRASFRGEGTVEGWVWGAVVNAARNHRRGRSGREAYAAENGWGWSASRPTATVEGVEARAGLRDEVALLPERQRLALFLRYYADLDYREIAAVLDVSVGTVGSTLNAAHAALRRALAGGVDDA